MSFSKLTRALHKWVSLFVGIQVLAWVVGGLVMSYAPLEKVRSEHLMKQTPEAALTTAELAPSLATMLAAHAIDGTEVREFRIKRSLDRVVCEIHKSDGTLLMLDASTGEMLSPLSEQQALLYAQRDFTGVGKPIAVQWLTEHNTEYHKALPVWRVDFNNEEQSHIYVSPANGEILARRSNLWRLYDFFWMLHIMDYKNRSDFNHPLLIGAAALSVLMALSGLFLIFTSFRRRDFGWKN